MAQRSGTANRDAAFAGVVDNAAYRSNQAFGTYDPNLAFTAGDHHPHGDAAWHLNANALHPHQQDLSRAHSRSPAWPHQQDQQDQQQYQHLAARPTSTVSNHNDLLRRSPLQAGTYAAPNPYNSYQAQSPHGLQQHQTPYQQPQQQYQHPPQQHYQQQQQTQPPPQHQQYDPTLLGTTGQFATHAFPSYANQTSDAHTIAPRSLEHEATLTAKPNTFGDRATATSSTTAPPSTSNANLVDQDALTKAVPAGQVAGLFTIIDFDSLVRATNSERISNFATIGRSAQEWPITRAALPAYTPRTSRNAYRRAAAGDPTLLAKLSGSKKSKSRLAASRAKLSHTSAAGDGRPTAKAGSVDLTSDESSDDDSEHTSDSDIDDSPLPAKRPDLPKDAIEYDTIGALWRSKRKAVDAGDVRKALVAFWEIVKTVRDRWKADTAAVTQAEEKGSKGELPYLRQRVKDQRDMLEIAFKTALKHGNRTILETLSENTPLIFLCYQFLLDRHKADDINGSLARAILELMALFNTLTDEKLEKTHLVKVLPRIIKSGDAKTQFYAKQITNKAAANKSAAASVAKAAPGDEKKTTLSTGAGKPDATTGSKRPGSALSAPTDPKRAALGAAKATTAQSTTNPPSTTAKKRLLGDDAAKNPAKRVATTNGASEVKVDASAPVAKAKPTSKLTSGLFAGLQSAAKKPGTSVKGAVNAGTAKDTASKPVAAASSTPAPAPARPAFSLADTMKSIAKPKEEKPAPKEEKEPIKETSEQKAKRLKKEARGHLRVHWKVGDDLVSIREFTHDPEEDMGHDSSQTRDVADLKGEGRMFKQQHNNMMDMDEDDEEALAPAKEVKMVEWFEPDVIDFSTVDEEERKRNYSRFAAGHLKPDSPETTEREKYEANTLMVFYSQFEDIPPSPREPLQPISGDDTEAPLVSFGAPDQKFVDRARQVRTMQQGINNGLSAQASSQAPIDFDKLRSVLSNNKAVSQPVQPASSAPDIMSILAKINQGQHAAQQPQQPFTAPNEAWSGILPQQAQAPQAAKPATTPGQPDISAILAQLKAAQQPAAPPPPIPFPGLGAPTMPGLGNVALDPGFLAFVAQQQAAAAQQNKPQPQQQQAPGIYENPERKRWRDGEEPQSGPDADGHRASYKTKACKYYLDGKCVKGDKCTYIHEGE